jgi:hypothetical protein
MCLQMCVLHEAIDPRTRARTYPYIPSWVRLEALVPQSLKGALNHAVHLLLSRLCMCNR